MATQTASSHRRLTASLALGLVAATSAHAGFYGDPPDAQHPWAIHDENRPQPPRVEPGTYSTVEKPGQPPSDAVILFDGTEAALSKWLADKNPPEPTRWIVKDGALQCVAGAGYIRTKEEFGDCQLHVEWAAPSEVHGDSQGRGNSGIFPMGQVEVQVLDNYNNPTYADGFAGSVYGVNPPLANPMRKPGEWQVYDIVFRRPLFKEGREIDPGSLTVFVNGVLVQDHTPLEGGGGHRARSKSHPYPDKGPLKLQDHGNPVRYRNIWYRPLPLRAAEGGDTSHMSEAATTAKRAQIATTLREAAAQLSGKAQMLKLLESLCYENQPAAQSQAQDLAADFAKDLAALPAAGLEAKKGDVQQVHSALSYVSKAGLIPTPNATQSALQAIITAQAWDKKK
jgi:Domain of Unknown Function (DUF1080)